MAYQAKTDWLPDDPINEDDVNRWEKGIKEAHTDLAAHKNDLNNPHETTKSQIGLGNVENVRQASKKEFQQHAGDTKIHISEDERIKWNAKETPAAAQKKADLAEENAKTYADQTFTNEKLTVLPASKSIQDARTPGSEYPIGITIMDIGQDNTTGYPLAYGFVKNENFSTYRFTQYFYGNGNGYLSTCVWVRQWYISKGWTGWHKISGLAYTRATINVKQKLDKGTYNKIKFNQKITDSHNAFNTSNNRFVAPNDGMYLVESGLYIDSFQTYSNFELTIYLNGKQYKNIAHYRHKPEGPSTSKEFGVGVYGSGTVPMKKGDYLEMYMYVGYDDVTRYISDRNEAYNYFEIRETGGVNPSLF
ncbi:hypothetical protein P9D34_19455 [Bacillus swezeyi]|uniref:Terminase n=1 Tax=Bacillus swezeyi TaxID=1925020 RepID=A0A1R1QPR4_9BACI|nr:hypothetical protein [Bacillus swezeyi]MEC1262557.1 hypothetical protein [Bacillus swezeyi]MED2926734.1 hypothetical protein [Bacillus swezeyi]MED2943487.1 hypothetical protein [Bacillus swezeyi]MED2965704.1 hypothetical protein [Bacillus swezeyi]MED3070893.1 hypothetical protein [Bacillus swezeyi]